MSSLPLPLLLASSSPARRTLLARLNLPFSCISPDIDEAAEPEEDVVQLVMRLSKAKARALAGHHPKTLIIGSDQALSLDGRILGKPGTHARAAEQLSLLAGREATFHTGLCLLNTASERCQLTSEAFSVRLRQLDSTTIERYLQADQPYECAGSFRAEGLGIALFEALQGRDPTSLIGLPLMALVDFLLNEGIAIP